MKAKNWSQGELAEQIEASRAIIGKYERNENLPSIEMVIKMAKAFDVSVDFLLGVDLQQKIGQIVKHILNN